MSTEQLLQKRYRTKDYPNSPFGDGVYTEVEIKYMAEIDPEKYPNQFSLVAWWEERKPEEMPKYLKHWKSGELFKIISIDYKYLSVFLHDDTFPRSFVNFLPATESEYNEYIKQQAK